MRHVDVLVLYTKFQCPKCGGSLELLEDETYVWLGCKHCMKYVKRNKRDLVRQYVNYRDRTFRWADMMSELYSWFSAD